MSNEQTITIPDIGGAENVDVIEILIREGDEISVDTPLITLESDKASMEIPSTMAGVIKSLKIRVGDKVSEGDAIAVVSTKAPMAVKSEEKPQTEQPKQEQPVASQKTDALSLEPQSMNVAIPDIGGATDVDVIEIMVKAGERVEKDQSLITLEGDKATMDIPSPFAGTIEKLTVKVGDKVSQGDFILSMLAEGQTARAAEKPMATQAPSQPEPEQKATAPTSCATQPAAQEESGNTLAAGPAVRRLAREFGADLNQVKGSGRKNRIMKEDIQAYVKARLSAGSSAGAGGFSLPEAPAIDFSKFGEIETRPLNKIKRLTATNLHRAWLTIPHVTQFDEADITGLEQFRKQQADNAKAQGYKLTLLAFVTKVVQKVLAKYPQFNASLDASGENLIYKNYFNVGIAVETPNGLVVPVIKGVDKLEVGEIAMEMARLSSKARDKGLMPADMNGGCFTISSLGGIGGTAFTPIVNSPEVAILGLSRSSLKPRYENGQWVPRLMLPLSLSYDHRVIDGAEAARFTREIADMLEDIRRIIL